MKTVEGVLYQRFRVRFRLADGRVRRWVRWSPVGGQWVHSEVCRELVNTYGLEGIKPRSCTIRAA